MTQRTYQQSAAVELVVTPDPVTLGAAAARIFAAQATLAIRRNGRFAVALSGGSTPKALFSQLVDYGQSGLDWSRIHFFWGDERCVPPLDAASNFRMAKEELIDHVSIPTANVHRIHGEDPPATAARDYEASLGRFFSLVPGECPRFDLIVLGLGEEGHTASLFPGAQALDETTRAVVATVVPGLPSNRITLTLRAINSATFVLVLVSGTKKSAIVRAVLTNPSHPSTLPMQGIHPIQGQLTWLLDAPAAVQIPALTT